MFSRVKQLVANAYDYNDPYETEEQKCVEPPHPEAVQEPIEATVTVATPPSPQPQPQPPQNDFFTRLHSLGMELAHVKVENASLKERLAQPVSNAATTEVLKECAEKIRKYENTTNEVKRQLRQCETSKEELSEENMSLSQKLATCESEREALETRVRSLTRSLQEQEILVAERDKMILNLEIKNTVDETATVEHYRRSVAELTEQIDESSKKARRISEEHERVLKSSREMYEKLRRSSESEMEDLGKQIRAVHRQYEDYEKIKQESAEKTSQMKLLQSKLDKYKESLSDTRSKLDSVSHKYSLCLESFESTTCELSSLERSHKALQSHCDDAERKSKEKLFSMRKKYKELRETHELQQQQLLKSHSETPFRFIGDDIEIFKGLNYSQAIANSHEHKLQLEPSHAISGYDSGDDNSDTALISPTPGECSRCKKHDYQYSLLELECHKYKHAMELNEDRNLRETILSQEKERLEQELEKSEKAIRSLQTQIGEIFSVYLEVIDDHKELRTTFAHTLSEMYKEPK